MLVTASDVRELLAELGFEELSQRVEDDWCWDDFGALVEELGVDHEAVRLVRESLLAEYRPLYWVNYYIYVEQNEEVRQQLLRNKNQAACLLYLCYIDPDDEEFLSVLISPFICARYCRHVKVREEFRQRVLNSSHTDAMFEYLLGVEDPEMFAAFTELASDYDILSYCKHYRDNSIIRYVVEKGTSQLMLLFLKRYTNDEVLQKFKQIAQPWELSELEAYLRVNTEHFRDGEFAGVPDPRQPWRRIL
jgi:hypothetical protein